ncbi:MAG: hypothetical protein Q9184_005943 [Pyrenodesmia sp. 2 TL-2023]
MSAKMGVLPKKPKTRPGSQPGVSDRNKVRAYLKTRYSENYINDLTHPINPIFAFDHWENVTSRKFLDPVLRLASLMLESPASQRMLYSLINPDTHCFLGHQDGKPRCHFRKSAAADDVVKIGVRIALQQLAKSLTYRWYKKLPQGVGVKAYAATYFDWPDDVGEDCHIGVLSKGFKKTFVTSTRRKKATDVNRWRFMLASTLCHEVAHALDGTYTHCDRASKDEVEHLYEYQTECEVGWAWEMEVLGAIRIGCDRIRDLDVLHALPTLDQNYEELDFDGKQHLCFVLPTISLVDYMTRPDRSFTGFPGFRLGPSELLVPRPLKLKRMIPEDQCYQALAERARWDDHLGTLLEEVSSGKASTDRIENLRKRLNALARRRYMATLIRRLNVRRLITERQDHSPEPDDGPGSRRFARCP